MTASRIILWRHGRSAMNATGGFQGQLDTPLDAVGLAQAQRSALVLADEIAGSPVRLVTSDLTRAAWTLASLAVACDLPSRVDEDVREVEAGLWQGLHVRDIAARWPGEYAAWRAGAHEVRAGVTGETRTEMGQRMAGAVRRHAAATPDGGTLLIATHGAVTRSGVLELTGLGPAASPALGSLGNARWAVLRPALAEVSAERHGDVDEGLADRWTLAGYDLGPRGPVEDQERLETVGASWTSGPG